MDIRTIIQLLKELKEESDRSYCDHEEFAIEHNLENTEDFFYLGMRYAISLFEEAIDSVYGKA